MFKIKENYSYFFLLFPIRTIFLSKYANDGDNSQVTPTF